MLLAVRFYWFGSKGTIKFSEISGGFRFVESALGILQSGGDAQTLSFFGVGVAAKETLEIVHMAPPEFAVDGLLCLEPGGIPIAGQQVFAGEQVADIRVVESFAVPGFVGHDFEQGPQRRTGAVDAAVVEIELRDIFLGGDDVVHTIGEDVQVLKLRP